MFQSRSTSNWIITLSFVIASAAMPSAAVVRHTNVAATAGLRNAVELVFVQGGEFVMGCPTNPAAPWQPVDYCMPEHKVFLSPFWVGQFPVSVAQFCEYLNGSGRAPNVADPAHFRKYIESRDGRYNPKSGKGLYAVEGISFKDAEAYCSWLSHRTGMTFRLPTEAEWEYAAKGGSKSRTYPWGDQFMETRPNPVDRPIGTYPALATPEGVFDLDGPVYQWCLDLYDDKFYARSTYKDPVCSQGSMRRVIRGGPMFRAYGRLFLAPTWKRFHSNERGGENIGFRVVLAPPPPREALEAR